MRALSPKFSLFQEQVEADNFFSSLNDEGKTSHGLIWLACCEVMSPVQHPSLRDWDDLMSGNASGRSEKTHGRSCQQFPQDMLSVPNSLVNRSQVTMLKHIPTHCNRERLNLKVTLEFVKMLCAAVWWRWGLGDKTFVAFQNKFHNLPGIISMMFSPEGEFRFLPVFVPGLAGISWDNSPQGRGADWCPSQADRVWQDEVRPGWSEKAPTFLISHLGHF